MAEGNQLPFEVKPLSEEETTILKKYWGNANSVDQLVRVGAYIQMGNLDLWTLLYNQPIYSTDIFVVSHPRSGTTWTQELVWLIANDFDFEKAKSISLLTRYLLFEQPLWRYVLTWCSEEEIKTLGIHDQSDENVEIPNRFIKTHVPLSLLPANTLDTAKIVYVARDPRDMMVSWYHINKSLKQINFQGDIQDAFDLFIKKLMLHGPNFEHVKEAWAQRHHPNMLFLFYEELSQDLKGTAKRVAKFLGKDCSEEQLDKLCEHLKFKNFQNNSAVNMDDQKSALFISPDEEVFIRKGKVGGWREHFTAEMTQRAERWMEDNLKDTDLRFPSFQN